MISDAADEMLLKLEGAFESPRALKMPWTSKYTLSLKDMENFLSVCSLAVEKF